MCATFRSPPASFGGGFPRTERYESRRAAQRAIFYVQRELEIVGDGGDPTIALCDRGTVDGSAYRTGPEDLWSAVGTTLAEQIARAWDTHPRRFFIDAAPDFMTKATQTLEILRGELPECCASHLVVRRAQPMAASA